MTEYKNSGYSEGGASYRKPTLKSWSPQHLSSKADVEVNLRTLQNRSADLVMNSALGSAAVNTMTTGVLSTGLQVYPVPHFQQLGISAEKAREWSRSTKLKFEQWASSIGCDFYGRNNFYEIQRIIFQSYLSDGDSFVLIRRREGLYTLKLQAIEAKRVSNPLSEGALLNNVEMSRGSHKIINGIEVDKHGRLIAIWISNRLWEELDTSGENVKWQRVKITGEHGTRNVLHICYDVRPEMYRGTPLLSPVIETMKQVARYSEAELTSAIVRSFFSLFFIQPASNYNLNEMLPQEEVDVSEYKLGSGTLSSLPRGVDVKSVESNNAQNTFESFVNQFTKQVGAALGIPAEVLMKEFKSSYSAARASLLEAEKIFRQRRQSFVLDFCQPVYELWLSEAVATGRVEAPGYFEDEFKRYLWSRADFRTEKNRAIDELKEITAAAKRIELGLSTREIESALIGNDFFENIEKLKIENKLIEVEE